MSQMHHPEHNRRRKIYEYIEENGAVEPEMVRQNVLVHPETGSKPTRSGGQLTPSTKMSGEEFNRHVSVLDREGYIDEINGKLRVAMPMDMEATTTSVGETEAVVRPAHQEDITAIVDVIETIAAVETYVVAARLAEKIDRDGVLLRHNESENRVFFVATVEEDVVGWLHVEGVQFPRMDHTAELTVGVLEEYRGNGLGSTLMERGLEWASNRDYQKVYQSLPATNAQTVDFLEDHGWSVESTREGHYLIDGELTDEVQLAFWLTE